MVVLDHHACANVLQRGRWLRSRERNDWQPRCDGGAHARGGVLKDHHIAGSAEAEALQADTVWLWVRLGVCAVLTEDDVFKIVREADGVEHEGDVARRRVCDGHLAQALLVDGTEEVLQAGDRGQLCGAESDVGGGGGG